MCECDGQPPSKAWREALRPVLEMIAAAHVRMSELQLETPADRASLFVSHLNRERELRSSV